MHCTPGVTAGHISSSILVAIVIFTWQLQALDRADAMNQDKFRVLALGFPEAVEACHFETADFRVRGKIFATLRAADGRAVLKLSPDEQQLVMGTSPGMFEPVKGSWGQKGWTRVALDRADAETVRHAMGMAWRSVAPKTPAGL
jgi:hypothetical protein